VIGQNKFNDNGFCQNDSLIYSQIESLLEKFERDSIQITVIDSSSKRIIGDTILYAKKIVNGINLRKDFYPIFREKDDDLICRVKKFAFAYDELFDIGIDFNLDKTHKIFTRRDVTIKHRHNQKKIKILNELNKIYTRQIISLKDENLNMYINGILFYSSLKYPKYVELFLRGKAELLFEFAK